MYLHTPGLLLLVAIGSATRTVAQVDIPAPPGTLLDRTAMVSVGNVSNPRDHVLIEGDIMMPLGQGPLGTYILRLWPGGVVPFTFDNNVNSLNQGRAQAAMAEWQNVANVTFRPRVAEDLAGIHFVDSTENSSFPGRVYFGPNWPASQNVNIRDWSVRFIIVHELGHALGFWHEQSRVDRDQYVRINTANIVPGQEHNFQIQENSRRYGPYDFDSVMHYGSCSLTACNPCCPTISVLPQFSEWQNRIGQRAYLSRMDGVVMSFLYPYAGWRFVDPAHTGTQSGTFLEPHRTLSAAVSAVPDRGTVWVAPGNYSAVGTYRRPMTISAPPHGPYAAWHSGVVLGR